MRIKTKREVIELDRIPNLAYFPSAISTAIKDLLRKIDGVEFAEDEFAIYARAKRANTSMPQILIDTHLDHPGFVIDESGRAVSIGTLHNSLMVKSIDFDYKQPVEFFDLGGEKLGSGYLVDFLASARKISAKPISKAIKEFKVNTQVLPRVATGIYENELRMRSVDNIATVQVCLDLLRYLSNRGENSNVVVVFNKLEEVAQLTTAGIALKGATPFGKIDKDCLILVLEAGPFLNRAVTQNVLGLSLSENGIAYGDEKINKLIPLIKSIAKSHKIKIMEVEKLSNTNAISYLLIGGYQNIACLSLNLINRHNIGNDGRFAPEIALSESTKSMFGLVTFLIEDSNKVDSLTTRRKFNQKEILKKKQLISAYYWALPRLKQEHLYPTNLQEKIKCIVGSVRSRLYFYFSQIR